MNKIKRSVDFDEQQYECLRGLAKHSKRSFPKYLEWLIDDHLQKEDIVNQMDMLWGIDATARKQRELLNEDS